MKTHNNYTVKFTDGTWFIAHGDNAAAVYDLWKSQEERIGKTVKNVYLHVDETEPNSASAAIASGSSP